MSMLHAESSQNCSDIGCLTETDSGSNFITVYLDGEELMYRAEDCDHVFVQEVFLDLDRYLVGHLRILHGDIINIQKYQNTIAAEIEIGIRSGLCEPKRE